MTSDFIDQTLVEIISIGDVKILDVLLQPLRSSGQTEVSTSSALPKTIIISRIPLVRKSSLRGKLRAMNEVVKF